MKGFTENIDNVHLKIPEESHGGERKISQTFDGSTVFLTGVTGFLGKLFMEKLLRTSPNLRMIYILVRPKRGKDEERRFKEIFEGPNMVPMKLKNPNYMDKVTMISGDCSLPDLDLEKDAKEKIIEETNFVIHCAATINFNEKLQTSTHINVRGVRDLIEIAKQMKNLKAFLHVSTAYSHCIRKDVGEEFYKCAITPDSLIDLVDAVDEERLKSITPGMMVENKFYVGKLTKGCFWRISNFQSIGLYHTYMWYTGFDRELVEKIVGKFEHILNICQEPGKSLRLFILLLGEWPNTYTFSKAVAEELIHREVSNLPIAVLRPSIIVATCNEPIEGWIDNFSGATGVILPSMLGILRSVQGKAENVADLIPADFVVNAGLAILWEISTQRTDSDSKIGGISPVYNIVSSTKKPVEWNYVIDLVPRFAYTISSEIHNMWHHSPFEMRKNPYHHELACFMLHTVPAYLVDFICKCCGKKTNIVEKYQKIRKFIDVVVYFTMNEWRYKDQNMQNLWQKMSPADKNLYQFNMTNFDWDEFSRRYITGMRVYLLKDPLETIPKGKVKYWKLLVAHYFLCAVLFLLIFKFLIFMYSWVF